MDLMSPQGCSCVGPLGNEEVGGGWEGGGVREGSGGVRMRG